MVTCKCCDKQYVGCSTTAMNIRHNGHKQEIREANTPLGRHFHVCGVENYVVQIIDHVKIGHSEALHQKEGIWAHRLATFVEHGNINIRDEMKL